MTERKLDTRTAHDIGSLQLGGQEHRKPSNLMRAVVGEIVSGLRPEVTDPSSHHINVTHLGRMRTSPRDGKVEAEVAMLKTYPTTGDPKLHVIRVFPDSGIAEIEKIR